MKIGFFELEGWEERIIKDNFPSDDIFLSQEKIDAFHIPERKDFDVLVIFVNSRISKEVLENFPNLKLIATRSTGFDHVDVAACKEKDITAVYVPGYGDNTVAEFAFGLILNLTRKIYQGIDQMKETESFSFAGLRGVDIKGKTIGIIGTGRIGKEAIKIAKGFSMKIVAFDPYPDPNFAAEQGIEYLPLDQLLGRSDVITIHAPYTPQTHHLINKDNISLIKKGSIFS